MKRSLHLFFLGITTCLWVATGSAVAGIPVQPPASIEFSNGEVDRFSEGVKLFTDRVYTLNAPPAELRGKNFLRDSIGSGQFRVTADGWITVLIPKKHSRTPVKGKKVLEAYGFQQSRDSQLFQLFGHDEWNQVYTYQKAVKAFTAF